jgi:hypothetical protein
MRTKAAKVSHPMTHEAPRFGAPEIGPDHRVPSGQSQGQVVQLSLQTRRGSGPLLTIAPRGTVANAELATFCESPGPGDSIMLLGNFG